MHAKLICPTGRRNTAQNLKTQNHRLRIAFGIGFECRNGREKKLLKKHIKAIAHKTKTMNEGRAAAHAYPGPKQQWNLFDGTVPIFSNSGRYYNAGAAMGTRPRQRGTSGNKNTEETYVPAGSEQRRNFLISKNGLRHGGNGRGETVRRH